ncbi:MAG TPA: 23S rRNA (uracil-5-)-methyltransferase RumA, partial [Candidatus Goldiibacteriota bacterium]|nr:23S rRNA (uracil-5-)-methyltransferase RumA [Candidatus Goldiibacteriota bacterium]
FPVCANAEDVVEKILYEKKIDEVVVDPPRKGLHPVVLFALKNSGVRNIIYVSCNPSTFARDVKELKEKYYLKEIIPLDQFAHTYHVELMAKLERKVKN